MDMDVEAIKSAPGMHISLHDIAIQLGVHGSYSAKRMAEKRGFSAYQILNAKNAKYYLSKDDAEKFINQIINEKNNTVSLGVKKQPSKGVGGVYCVEVPSYDGKNRIKIGWTDNFEQRLTTYRTIVPDLKVWALWQCRDSWMERAAHKIAEQLSNSVYSELFEFNHLDQGLMALSAFFSSVGIKDVYK